MFGKMNFKVIVLALAGLVSIAAGQAEIPAPLHPDTGIWIQQIGDLVPHAVTKGTLYYTKYEPNDRVKSIDYLYDGLGHLQIFTESKDTLCTEDDGINGSSGIVLHPDGDLLVAAQGERIYKVSTTAKKQGGSCRVATATPATQKGGFWHLMMDPNGENLWGAGIPGYLYRFSTKTGPNNIASTGYQVELNPKGPKHEDIKKLTAITWDGEGTAFFTHSDYYGGGCEAGGGTSACSESTLNSSSYKQRLGNTYFGVLTDTTKTEVTSVNKSQIGGNIGDTVITKFGTKVLIDSLEGAHGVSYDPYSKTIFVFGGAKIVQIQPYRENGEIKAKVVATIDMREYFFEESNYNLSRPRTAGVGWRLHQGSADGLGHLFVASNSGHLIFVDYSSNPKKLIKDNIFMQVQWIDNYLDALTFAKETLPDEDNSAPEFTSISSTYEVSENTPIGTKIGEFVVHDEDDSDLDKLTIIVTDNSATTTRNAAKLFEVVQVGKTNEETHLTQFAIMVKQDLDYEVLYKNSNEKATFNVTLTVLDDGGHAISQPITLQVNDVNEVPYFAQTSYIFAVPENITKETSLGIANAYDPDIYNPEYSTLYFTLDGEDATSFNISESSGEISTSKSATIDYETKNVYEFYAVVTDNTFTKTIPVTVAIEDVNEDVDSSSSANNDEDSSSSVSNDDESSSSTENASSSSKTSSSSSQNVESSSSINEDADSSSSANNDEDSSSSVNEDVDSSSSASSNDEYSSSSKNTESSSSSYHYVVSSSSANKEIKYSSSANNGNVSSSSNNDNKPGFYVRMTGSFEFEIVLDEDLPRLARQYAVMDMKGQVLYTGELSNREARVKVSTPGAYVIRVGLGYKKVNVK